MTKTKAKRTDDFTRLYPIGTMMNYRSHPGAEPRQVKVISAAFILSEHTPCVYVDGVSGCVALDALKRLPVGQLHDNVQRVGS